MINIKSCTSAQIRHALQMFMSLKGRSFNKPNFGIKTPCISRQTQESLEIIEQVAAIDPTGRKLKYTRWMLNRLWRNPVENMPYLEGDAKAIMVQFNAIKHLLDEDLRDVFRFNSFGEIETLVNETNRTRVKPLKNIMNTLDPVAVMNDTHLLASNAGIEVCKPRNVEDLIVLMGMGDNRFKQHRQIMLCGQPYVFLTGAGPIAGCVSPDGERGMAFDSFGEPAIFEDALMIHPEFNWSDDSEIMSLMCQIDPSLPFDLDLEEAGPFLVALKQFPLVLHEDRFIPDSLYDEIIADPVVGPMIRETECA